MQTKGKEKLLRIRKHEQYLEEPKQTRSYLNSRKTREIMIYVTTYRRTDCNSEENRKGTKKQELLQEITAKNYPDDIELNLSTENQ